MKFAKIVFWTAGIYGLVTLPPLFFFKDRFGWDNPPPITHPEFYFGFLGVCLAFQLVFCLIGRDPEKYRLLMWPAMVEKFSWVAVLIWLWAQGNLPPSLAFAGTVDLILGLLFVAAYLQGPRGSAKRLRKGA